MHPTRQLPAMPEIGRPESFYAKLVHTADRQGDTHGHEAAKVGQYVTLAMDPSLHWEEKLKYFQHALKRHCVPPPYPDDDVWMFYQQLAELVRAHCGQEALRLASLEDDLYGTFRSARYTAAHSPGARFIGYARGGHAWVGHHEEIFAQLVAFLGGGTTLSAASGR